MGPVEALDAALVQHLSAIQRAAIASPPGGGGEWDTLLRHYGHTPFDPQERTMSVSNLRLARGAVPAELRVVLLGLQQWAQGELGPPASVLSSRICSGRAPSSIWDGCAAKTGSTS